MMIFFHLRLNLFLSYCVSTPAVLRIDFDEAEQEYVVGLVTYNLPN